MAYNLDKGLLILKQTIKLQLKHQDYKRVNEIADEYTRYVTGEDIGALLKQFNPRESNEQFEQRKQLSQAITSDIANRILTPMYKIGRTRAEISIVWDSENAKNENNSELLKATNDFYGDESVESYLTRRMVELDGTDPNSFIVVEFDGFVDETDPTTKAEPYPFEVNSKEAINYRYINGELQFLIVENCYSIESSKGEIIAAEKYTLYLDNESVVAERILAENIDAFKLLNPLSEILVIENKDTTKNIYYSLTVVEHKAGRIPARRVGTKKDLTTRSRTCVPIMHPAHPYFKKSIKTVSEFDLTNCLHTFQQKIQYDEVCHGNTSKQIICNSGKNPEGNDCTECKGTGWKTHTSSADIIRVRLPKDPKDMVSLENYMTYKGPKMDLLEFQKKLGLYELTELAIKAVYTSDLYTTDSISTTATEKNIDLESVYDTLKPFADNWSAMWKHIVNVIASYRDLGTGIVISHKFPKDFKMKSLSMLLDDLTKANASGAPSYVKNEINKDIAQKIYNDEPNELLELNVKNKYYPFNGKTESEINNIITNSLTTRYNQVLYANFDSIFAVLDEEQEAQGLDFYKLEKSIQSTLVTEAVNKLILELDTESSLSNASTFNSQPEGGEGNTLSQSVGGLTGMIEIAKAVASGLYDLEAAIALVSDRFGITPEEARKQLGTPTINGETQLDKVTQLV